MTELSRSLQHLAAYAERQAGEPAYTVLAIQPRALVTFAADGTITIAPDLTLDEARYVIEQLATMAVSRGMMRESTIESETSE